MRFMMLLPAPVEALEKCAVPDRRDRHGNEEVR